MTLNYERILALALMGMVQDNIDTSPDTTPIEFAPDGNCLVFVPSITKNSHLC